MQKPLAIGLIVVSIIGLYLGVNLTEKHFLLIHQPEVDFDSVCDQSETLNCSKVNSSKYSSFDLGEGRAELPIAIPAIGFFALSGCVALFLLGGAAVERKKKALAALVLLADFGVAFGLYLIYIQAFKVKAWCLFCLGVDASTLGVGLLAFFAHGGGIKGVIDDLKAPDMGLAAMGLVVMLAITGGAYGNYNGKVRAVGGLDKETLAGNEDKPTRAKTDDHGHSEGDGHNHDEASKALADMSPEEKEAALAESRTAIKEFLTAHAQQERKELTINSYDGTKGNPNARVTIIEWADFECPHCKQAAFYMQDIVQRYYDHVYMAFRNYPLGKPCNTEVSRNMHPMSCEAAWGTQCARREGVFFDFHNQAFDAQGSLSSRRLEKIAVAVGMDKGWYQECINRNDIRNEVVDQLQQGRDVGVRGTPTFFVNGRELLSIHPLAVEAAIRYELIEAGLDPAQLPPDNEDLFPN
ncbi:MAG: thioredoxin domain-containing protein [Proteobacteria bacterium]|nr:thioredoxin domain-containing protein [Pseudomonadota bacterium]